MKPDKIIKLRDTRGNFSMDIKLPSKDYKPKLSKQEYNRRHVKQYYEDHPDKLKEHYEYIKNWRKRNQDRIKQHAKTWWKLNGKQYYENNKPRFLQNNKRYIHNKNMMMKEGYRISKYGSRS